MSIELREVVKRTASYLTGVGLPAARLEAELLVGSVIGLDRTQLYAQFDRCVTEAELAALRSLMLARAKERIPIAYLIGRKLFLGLDLLVPKGVFIPRPETEELVEAVLPHLREIGQTGKPLRILDLCTGTGVIAIALARRFSSARVVAVDCAPEAVHAAVENIDRFALVDRVEVRLGDLWQPIPEGEIFSAIIANPPYIARALLRALPMEVARHEPATALDGGEDGLDFYRRIIPASFDRLPLGGLLALEHGDDQAHAVASLAHGAGFLVVETRNDMAGKPRILLARREASSSWLKPDFESS